MGYEIARANMVDNQIKTNRVTDLRLIEALERLPRERFVPEAKRGIAYVDEDIDLGGGRWLMEPMVLARLLQAADVQPDEMVLVIGCATGYAAAVLAHLAATVVALESDDALAAAADAVVADLEIDNLVVVRGTLTAGYAKQAPYDVILIDGAVAEIPPEICDQLSDGGRLVTVRRAAGGVGRATLLERHGAHGSSRSLFDAAVHFLPGFAPAPGFVF